MIPMLHGVELHVNISSLAHRVSFTQLMQSSNLSMLEHYCLILADPRPVNFLLIRLCMIETTHHLIADLPDLQIPL